MTAKNYHSKVPSEAHFKGVALAASENEKASLPHANSIRVGRALVHYVPSKGAWAAPYNRHSDPSLQWIHSRAEAKRLAERICLLLGK
jgi:hypothetical protein